MGRVWFCRKLSPIFVTNFWWKKSRINQYSFVGTFFKIYFYTRKYGGCMILCIFYQVFGFDRMIKPKRWAAYQWKSLGNFFESIFSSDFSLSLVSERIFLKSFEFARFFIHRYVIFLCDFLVRGISTNLCTWVKEVSILCVYEIRQKLCTCIQIIIISGWYLKHHWD